jgi:MFS family permease
MTDENLGLLCKEPIFIGFIGSVSFVSISIGSILISRYMDKLGRKPVVVYSAVMTPIGLMIFLIF